VPEKNMLKEQMDVKKIEPEDFENCTTKRLVMQWQQNLVVIQTQDDGGRRSEICRGHTRHAS
jgi:hypothetical protein